MEHSLSRDQRRKRRTIRAPTLVLALHTVFSAQTRKSQAVYPVWPPLYSFFSSFVAFYALINRCGPFPKKVESSCLVGLKYEKSSKECISWIASTLHRAYRNDMRKARISLVGDVLLTTTLFLDRQIHHVADAKTRCTGVAIARRRFSLAREMRYLGGLCQRHNLAEKR